MTMKKIFISLTSVLLMKLHANAQFVLNQGSYIVSQGNTSTITNFPTVDRRVFLQVRNTSTSSSDFPFASVDVSAGGNTLSTSIAHVAREYSFPTPNGIYSGFGQIYSQDRGLILRTGSSNNPNGVIKFMTGHSFGSSIERMRLDADGNFGIGTEQPKAKVQVTDGDVYIDNPNRGIIMKDVNNKCWRITLGAAGNLVTSEIPCP